MLIPRIMQALRHSMRSGHGSNLSVPQFRTLAMVAHHPGASLSDAAAHVGLGLPAMSVQVDGLVRRRLLTRLSASGDRRRKVLSLTPGGQALLDEAQAASHAMLTGRLGGLSSPELAAITAAVQALDLLFADEPATIRTRPTP